MFKLPNDTIWVQNNRSDRLGDLCSSYNLDLTSNLGSLRVSPRGLLNVSSTDLANLGVPCAARFYTTDKPGIWVIAGARVFQNKTINAGGLNTAFIQDATSGTPTDLNSDQSDMEEFNGALYFSGASTSLYKLAPNATWSTLSSLVSSTSGNHAMVYFKPQNRLYFIDDNAAGVGSINTSDAAATLGNQYTLNDLVFGAGNNTGSALSWIDANSTSIFIGEINLDETTSRVFYWNGSTADTVDGFYTIDASGTLACLIVNDVPVILDTRGRLLQLNGGTFVELARLPFENETPTTFDVNATLRLCHYNGIELIDGKINILVNTTLYDTNSTNKENVPSGVWEYTKETGLYHKASIGQTKSNGTIVDYGQQKLKGVGCLQELKCFSTITRGTTNGKFLAGATYYTNATSTLNGIFYDDSNDTLQKAGGFTTSKIFSSNITEIWQKIYLRFRKLLTATDKMVVKYRTEEEDSSEITVTWAGTNAFTTSTNLLGKEGWEIEVLQGQGSGECSHITSAILQDGVYQIGLDETLTNKSGTAKIRLQNWKKFGSCTSQSEDFKQFSLNTGSSTWIQFKVWVLSIGKNEINDLIIINKVQTPMV